MAINKVVFGNEVQMDLTEDTVTEDKVLEGETFHDRSGNSRVGSLVIPVQDVEVNGESVVDAEGIAEVVVPVSGDVSTTDSFESYTGGKVKSVQMELSPIQDLHGYSEPWVGGAGKNKLDKDNYVLSYTSDNLVIIGTVNIESGKSYTFSCEQDKDLTGSTRNTLAVTYDGNTYYEMVNSNYHNEKGTHTYNFTSNYTGTATLAFWCHTPSDTSITYSKFMFQEGVYTSYEPYENICPIFKQALAIVEQRGKNLSESQTNNTDLCHVEGGKTYTLSYSGAYLFNLDIKYDGDTSYSRIARGADVPYTFTPSRSGTINLNCYNNDISEIQVELGSSATDYEPYQGKDYTINLGGTYYWLRGDVVSGKWYVVGQSDDLGTLTWQTRYTGSVNKTLSSSLSQKPLWAETAGEVQCEDYKYNGKVSGASILSDPDNCEVGLYLYYVQAQEGNAKVCYLVIPVDNSPDGKVVYELNDTIPINLDPQRIEAFLGENNFSAPLEQQEIIEIVARNIAEFNEVIDDENISDEFTYSSEKIEDRLDEYVDKDAVEEKSATDEFTTINGGLLSSCKVSLSPNQDLHGYDSPWVGGAGKNKLPLVLADIKALNTSGTWSDNVYTVYGVSFTINTDDDGNVTYIDANGMSPSDTAQITLTNNTTFLSGSYIGNGCPSGGGGSMYRIRFAGGLNGNDYGSQTTTMTADPNTAINVYIRVDAGVTADHLKFYPMLRLSTESDPTFEPYSNICPISGHTQVEVENHQKNLFKTTATDGSTGGITYTVNDDGSVSVSGTRTSSASKVIGRTNVTSDIGKITVSGLSDSVNIALNKVHLYNSSDVELSSRTAFGTIDLANYPSVAYLTVDVKGTANGDVASGKVTIQVEKGESSTTWAPYNGYQVTVNLGGTYYSGTLDAVSGVFVPDTAEVDLGSLTFNRTEISGVGYRYYASDLSDIIKNPTDVSVLPNIVCEQYAPKLPSQYNQAVDGITVYTNGSIQIYDSTRNTLSTSDFKTAMSGVQLVYELANPTPIQLSPTMVKALVGENHLSAPLEGQEITESKYRELFTWDDVEEIAKSIADSKIDNIYTSYNTTFSSAFTEARYVKKIYGAPVLTALQIVLSGATSITFNHQLIFSDSQTCCELIQFGSGARIGITDVTISQGSVTFTFDSPLTKAIGFRCRITNDFVS